jgi:hypothetical protein
MWVCKSPEQFISNLKIPRLKKFTLILLHFGLAFGAYAQPEQVLPFLSDVFQSSWSNPSVWPDHAVSVGLPGISSVFAQGINKGFVLNNVVEIREDTAHLMPTRLLEELKEKNLIYAGASVDLFHVRVKFRNGFYWIGARTRAEANVIYPKELISLAIEGNAPYVGKILDLGNLQAGSTVYNEYSIGASNKFDRWVFGIRVSFLQGLAQAGFEPRHLKLGIDSAVYAYTFDADARIRTAGLPGNTDGSPDFSLFEDPGYSSRYFTNFGNPGLSFSAGATFRPNDRFEFSAAVSDLGFISWKDSVTSYTLKGQSEFAGLDLLRSYLYHTPVNADSILDGMADDFERDTVHQGYTTRLHPQMLISARYAVFPRTLVGLSVSAVYNKKFNPALTLGVSQGLGRYFNLMVTGSWNRTIRNLGVGLMVKPGPLQFYVVADNLWPLINPLYTTNVNVRAGINLVFGQVKKEQGLPYR